MQVVKIKVKQDSLCAIISVEKLDFESLNTLMHSFRTGIECSVVPDTTILLDHNAVLNIIKQINTVYYRYGHLQNMDIKSIYSVQKTKYKKNKG